MKVKTLFILNTVVSIPFGIGCVLAPHLFLSLFGATLNPPGALMMQYGGAWLIGTGLVTWLTRNIAGSEARRSIIAALLAAYIVAFIVSLLGQLTGVLNALGWMPVAIQIFFVAGLSTQLIVQSATT